jgi:hypothetical protein
MHTKSAAKQIKQMYALLWNVSTVQIILNARNDPNYKGILINFSNTISFAEGSMT